MTGPVTDHLGRPVRVTDTEAATDAEVSLAVLPAGARARGAVCFTYDDAYVSKRTVADLAAARGQRNTFFLTSDLLDKPNRLTRADVLRFRNQGHEIGAHSKDHSNLSSLATTALRVPQYDVPRTALESILGAGSVRSWAYPFGARTATTDQELYGRYRQIFATGQDVPCIVPLEDRVGRFIYGRQGWYSYTHSTVLDLVRLAASSPVVVIIYAHDPGNTSGSFPTDPTVAQVTEAYDLAASLGVPCLTVGEALPSGNLVRNGGFEDGLTGWNEPLARPAGLLVETAGDVPADGLPGSKSLHIRASSAPGANFILEQVIPAKPNASYSYAARWRGAGITAGQLQFDLVRLDATGAQIAATTSVLAADAPWTRNTRTLTTEPNTAALKIKYILLGTTVGEFHLDHVDLRPAQFGSFG